MSISTPSPKGVSAGGELWLDFLVVLGFFVVMLAAATRAYPKAIL
jgi:hypothetical protein